MNILNYLFLLTFPISLISGLFVAPLTCVIVGIILLHIRSNLRLKDFIISKLECAMLSYVFCSSLWSIAPKSSILVAAQLATIILLARFTINKSALIKIDHMKLLFGIILALIVFYIEKYSHGTITLFFRDLTSHNHGFNLSFLDRGCALLSVTVWPILYMLIREGKKVVASILYVAVFITLLMSDSTAGQLGFVMASIGYLLLNISKMKIMWLVKISMIIYLIAMPIISKMEEPRYIAKEYGHIIPISYIHRLLIWNFVVNKSLEHPIIGQGIGTSKFTHINEEDKFFYKNEILSPLPLHPHNNMLQIFLELGSLGVVFFGLYIWQILTKISNVSLKTQDILWGATAIAAFINYFVIGMVAFGIWQSWWMLSGLLVVILVSSAREGI